MKTTARDFLHGGLFALIYNLVSLGLTLIFNLCGAEVLLIPLLIPIFLIICYLYYRFAKARTPCFLFGMLALHISIVVLSAILSIPFGDAILNFFAERSPRTILAGVSFMYEYFARTLTGLLPPLVHLAIIALNRRKQTAN